MPSSDNYLHIHHNFIIFDHSHHSLILSFNLQLPIQTQVLEVIKDWVATRSFEITEKLLPGIQNLHFLLIASSPISKSPGKTILISILSSSSLKNTNCGISPEFSDVLFDVITRSTSPWSYTFSLLDFVIVLLSFLDLAEKADAQHKQDVDQIKATIRERVKRANIHVNHAFIFFFLAAEIVTLLSLKTRFPIPPLCSLSIIELISYPRPSECPVVLDCTFNQKSLTCCRSQPRR